MGRGQASLLDILLLGFSISLVTALGWTSGNGHLVSHVIQEESGYADSMLRAVMGYRNQTFGGYLNEGNLTLAQALNLWYCTGRPELEEGLGETFRYLLDRMVKPGYRYIFYTGINRTGYAGALTAWNSQPTVETDRLALKSFNLTPSCPCLEYFPPTLGIWPGWRNLPEAGDD